MSGFDRLAPPVQHHIVNALGWTGLRPLQDEAVEPILAGENALLLAPTAGGKTEAALFPLLSKLSEESWPAIAVLYICPIKALLNNLEPRLRAYTSWIGRTVGLWHGDVPKGARDKMLAHLPDIMLITPESLEVILTSRKLQPDQLFAHVGAVVVDEIHAFAGDDRGWHLMAVVDRIEQVSTKAVQRIGLSATVGNPDALLYWLGAGTGRPGRVIAPAVAGPVATPDVQIDYVGSLQGAATVISMLHEGEKRLVFTDSRSQAETLTGALRALEVTTFVSHSSLSATERRQAESAFSEARGCVIVATSTLELGIDVGDLDRVIQIDAPYTVASFLQRLGRTGRRGGTRRNCLFLATNQGALIRTLALVRLWESGYIEPVVPPARPYPVLAQQILALCLQPGERGRNTWHEWLPAFLVSTGIGEQQREALVQGMVAENYLNEDGGLLSPGPKAEKAFGHKHWMALFSVFNSPPMFLVTHGRTILGSVHELSFPVDATGPITLSLGGRNWRVIEINRIRRRAQVEPGTSGGRSRWLAGGNGLPFALCQASREVVGGRVPQAQLSRRAKETMAVVELRHAGIADGESALMLTPLGAQWWTFGGGLMNAALARQLGEIVHQTVRHDSCSIRFPKEIVEEDVTRAVRTVRQSRGEDLLPSVDRDMLRQLKFSECVPQPLLELLVAERYSSIEQWEAVSGETLRVLHVKWED